MLKILCFQKKMPIFAIQKKTIKITIMKQKYRIRIVTTEGVIKRKFYKKEIALSTIIKFKNRFDDFLIGILSEKIKGKWNPICILPK